MNETSEPYPYRRLGQRFLPLALLFVLLAGLIWSISALSVAGSTPQTPNTVSDLSGIPVEVHRRAVQHLQEVRNTDMAPGWETSVLGEDVQMLYRPDNPAEPAYYEIPVLPLGFIILAADENDFPIAHWDFDSMPPSSLLYRESGGTAVRYYKLDTLAYAAEDEEGNLVATLGQLPPKVTGMDMGWLDEEQELTETAWVPNETPVDDSDAGSITGTLVITGSAEPPTELVLSEWESWDALKDGYAENYAVFLEQQKREASEAWRGEKADQEYGIVLVKEQVYDVALLDSSPNVTLDGPGMAYVTTEMVPQGENLPEIFRVTVAGSVPLGNTPFTATIFYGNLSIQETVRFQIVQNHEVYLPLALLNNNGEGSTLAEAAQADTNETTAVAWSGWTSYWAGTHDDQRLYNQIAANTSPNTSNCASGCGATAWAMLFGWADKKAADGNAAWAGRWGIYRENGGKGADAVAPRTTDSGVRNMMWDIRQRIGTFCSVGMGATAPWNMQDASGYLSGRSTIKLYTHYNAIGIHEDRLRNRVRDSIVTHKIPAIIGTGWLAHYPLAYGYRVRSRQRCFIGCWTEYQRQFYVNQGWSGNNNGWVSASTWFAGEIRP